MPIADAQAWGVALRNDSSEAEFAAFGRRVWEEKVLARSPEAPDSGGDALEQWLRSADLSCSDEEVAGVRRFADSIAELAALTDGRRWKMVLSELGNAWKGGSRGKRLQSAGKDTAEAKAAPKPPRQNQLTDDSGLTQWLRACGITGDKLHADVGRLASTLLELNALHVADLDRELDHWKRGARALLERALPKLKQAVEHFDDGVEKRRRNYRDRDELEAWLAARFSPEMVADVVQMVGTEMAGPDLAVLQSCSDAQLAPPGWRCGAQRLLQQATRAFRAVHLLPADAVEGKAAGAAAAHPRPEMHTYNQQRAVEVLRLIGEAAEEYVVAPLAKCVRETMQAFHREIAEAAGHPNDASWPNPDDPVSYAAYALWVNARFDGKHGR